MDKPVWNKCLLNTLLIRVPIDLTFISAEVTLDLVVMWTFNI